jgi:hypothetical protein
LQRWWLFEAGSMGDYNNDGFIDFMFAIVMGIEETFFTRIMAMELCKNNAGSQSTDAFYSRNDWIDIDNDGMLIYL